MTYHFATASHVVRGLLGLAGPPDVEVTGLDALTCDHCRQGHHRRCRVDDSELRRLRHRPRVSFDQGLAETVDQYRRIIEHPARRK